MMAIIIAKLDAVDADLGIDMDQAAGELPDQVAVEFEALAYALSRPDCAHVAEALVTDHLGQWLPRLCRAVATEAGHPFYAGLAAVTLDWLRYIERYVAPATEAGPSTQ